MMKRLHKLPKHTKHVLRVTVFVIAAVIVLAMKRFGLTGGWFGTTIELLAGTVVDRIFPQGSFFGSIDS